MSSAVGEKLFLYYPFQDHFLCTGFFNWLLCQSGSSTEVLKNITEIHVDIILNMQPAFKLAQSGSKMHPATEKNILVVQPMLSTKFLLLCWQPHPNEAFKASLRYVYMISNHSKRCHEIQPHSAPCIRDCPLKDTLVANRCYLHMHSTSGFS